MTDYELTRAVQMTASACVGIMRQVRARENNSPFTVEEAIQEIKQKFIEP
jgi:hypothetical protein